MRSLIILLLLLCGVISTAQEYENVIKKQIKVQDSIVIDSVSLVPSYFKVQETTGKLIDSSFYHVDFPKAIIYFKNKALLPEYVNLYYLPVPAFLTQNYQLYDEKSIVPNNSTAEKLIQLQRPTISQRFIPFDGLKTTGSISRGLRVGNNQNAVVDSELDLRITGALNDRVSLRASIQDANVPQTQNGYAQRLDEFDQIFIELYSDDWSIRAGDVDLQQSQWQFNNFTKKVQGIAGNILFKNDESQSYARAAGALVRGTFNISRFTGQEGNQGPYKLTGRNNELFILIVSGSERVYVNGVPLTRGQNADYVIDYNAGELRFNPTFPITSEMRISIEYQYSERNFTRFIGYGSGGFKKSSFSIDTYIYTESDAKNQPLQQELSEQQIAILEQAGDNEDAFIAPSAIEDSFSENKILYRKETIGGVERFVFSQDPNEQLFNVRFSLVGQNQGNYRLVTDQTISNIYEYVPPVNNIPQGDYEPIVRLFAPEILSIAGVKAHYQPSTTTTIHTELAASSNDINRFSSIDDNDNRDIAASISIAQRLWKKDSLTFINTKIKSDYIGTHFRNVERVYNIEFNRDWNIDQPQGNQLFTSAALEYVQDSSMQATYQLEHLEFKDNYHANRHHVQASYRNYGWESRLRGSLLNTNATALKSTFNRLNTTLLKRIKNKWIGAQLDHENNQQTNKTTGELTPLSQRFTSYEVYAGVGDSTARFIEAGYRHRKNDSLRNNQLQMVNRSSNYYLRSQPIKNKYNSLRLYANYRILISDLEQQDDEVSFNSRLQYQRQFYDKKIVLNTTYETNSASIPRQDFTYLEVNPGQGTYTWIDYNGDGIQDLNEFEVAQFQDQARYVRILLPNQIFIPTHQNKLSATMTINPSNWQKEKGWKKHLSHFYNQTSFLIDRMIERDQNTFTLNPFTSSGNQLGLNSSFRNSLFFNRGKQYFTTNYTYLNTATENLQSIGSITSKVKSHQLLINHKVKENWLVNLQSQVSTTTSDSENFVNRNYKIDELLLRPQVSYLFDSSNKLDLFYEYQEKENRINDTAQLTQHNLGVSWLLNKAQQYAINGELRFIENNFTGQAFSPVGFQILEGLQPGTNITWNLLFQKNLTRFLDLNLSYNGRNSSGARTIHNGSIQLKAYF